jgi:hypothetical protein
MVIGVCANKLKVPEKSLDFYHLNKIVNLTIKSKVDVASIALKTLLNTLIINELK